MKRAIKVAVLAVMFGLGSVFSNRGNGELAAYLKDQRNERQNDDDRDPLPPVAVVALKGDTRKILI